MTPNHPTTGTHAPQTNIQYLNTLPPGAELVTFGHRSGAETHQRCPRAYYYGYEYLGRGISQSPGPLYFAVGSALHHGLASLLLDEGIDAAVRGALEFLFNTAAFGVLLPDQQTEQEVLVYGLLYAFHQYAMPNISKNFEVLAVETGAVEYIQVEGDKYIAMQSRPDAILRDRRTHEVAGWSWKSIDDPSDMRRSQLHNDLQGFMELYYGERLLQGMAGAPVTRQELSNILAGMLKELGCVANESPVLADIQVNIARLQELEERARAARNIPTQIDYIQTVFLVKGPRKLYELADSPFTSSESAGHDNDDEYGGYSPDKVYKQMSHLCYRYRNGTVSTPDPTDVFKTGPRKGQAKLADPHDPNFQEESWAYRFFKPNNSTGSALSNKWLTSPIQPDQIRGWVDKLMGGSVYPTTMGDERNQHPIDKLILFEQPMYRDATRSKVHTAQQQRRFVQIAGAVQRMNEVIFSEASVTGIKEALDEEFPQFLINCKTPYKCAFHKFCHTPAENEIDFSSVPQGFELRVPHHEMEREYKDSKEDKQI